MELIYKVEHCENINSVAEKFGTSVAQIQERNGLNDLREGMRIIVNMRDKYYRFIKPSDNIVSLALEGYDMQEARQRIGENLPVGRVIELYKKNN